MAAEVESIPPYWRSTWFKVMLGLAALALGFVIVGNYIQNRLQRQRTEFDRIAQLSRSVPEFLLNCTTTWAVANRHTIDE
jgi:flagellar biogenesis protein FliO